MIKNLNFVATSLVGLTAAFAIGFTFAGAAEESAEAKPKHKIKEVMKAAHTAPEGQKSLRDRVLEGQAKPEEKLELLDLYVSLAQAKPPKGDAEAWSKKTNAIVLSAAKILVGRDGAIEELRVTTACAECHKDFKPPK